MRVKKKKSIEELETELEEFITNSDRSEDDIHNDVNDYRALKRKIDNPDSRHDNDDIWRMKDLHDVYLLGMNICKPARLLLLPPPPPPPPLPLPHPTL